MMKYKVEKREFEDFTEQEQEKWCKSDNGCGKEYASYLVVMINDEISNVYSDAMEPEDVSFTRDLKWIKSAIEDAFNCGKES